MIDLKLLQKEFDTISKKLIRKGVDSALLKKLKIKNEELKTAKIVYENLQATQNAMSKEFGVYKREGKDISELKAKVDANATNISKNTQDIATINALASFLVEKSFLVCLQLLGWLQLLTLLSGLMLLEVKKKRKQHKL